MMTMIDASFPQRNGCVAIPYLAHDNSCTLVTPLFTFLINTVANIDKTSKTTMLFARKTLQLYRPQQCLYFL